jgi:hypothetical protein
VISVKMESSFDLIQARLWLDEEPLKARQAKTDSAFLATLRGRPEQPLKPGTHVVVAYGGTTETASATAWTFDVEG